MYKLDHVAKHKLPFLNLQSKLNKQDKGIYYSENKIIYALRTEFERVCGRHFYGSKISEVMLLLY